MLRLYHCQNFMTIKNINYENGPIILITIPQSFRRFVCAYYSVVVFIVRLYLNYYYSFVTFRSSVSHVQKNSTFLFIFLSTMNYLYSANKSTEMELEKCVGLCS
jgi:hypothetical protein